MSTPPFLDLPRGVRAVALAGTRGSLAALQAEPTPASRPSRSPVVLVPGFTGSKEDFIAVLAPIAAAGHPVVAFDQRGQFESAGDADPASYDVKGLAEDVLTVAGLVGGRAHLVGHSFGGLVARAAVLADPGAMASLTLMGSGPAAIPHPSAGNLELIASALPVLDLETIWVAKRQIEAQTETAPPPAHIEEWMHHRFVSNHPVSLRRIAEQLLAEPDRVDELAALDLPMLVVHGEHDDAWPPAEQSSMAARLGAQVACLTGAGHSPAATAPEATAAALLAFWTSL